MKEKFLIEDYENAPVAKTTEARQGDTYVSSIAWHDGNPIGYTVSIGILTALFLYIKTLSRLLDAKVWQGNVFRRSLYQRVLPPKRCRLYSFIFGLE